MPNDIKGILEVLRNNPREYFIKGMDYVFTNPLNSKLVGQAFKLELELLAKKEHHIFAISTSDVASILEIWDFSRVETNLLKQLYYCYQSELSSIENWILLELKEI